MVLRVTWTHSFCCGGGQSWRQRAVLSGKPAFCCLSVAKSCLTLCNPTNCSMTDSSVLHYLPEFAQTHLHWVNDAIQPSHPLSASSLSVLSLSQHQSFPANWLFALGGQSIGASVSVSVLPVNIQGWSPVGWTTLIFLQSNGLSRVFSNTTVHKHQFFGTQPSLWSSSHIHTWLLEKP